MQTGTGGDTLLGAGTAGTGGSWMLPNVSTAGLPAGTYTYYAVATDNYAASSAAASTTQTAEAVGITIGSITIDSNAKNIVTGFFDLVLNVPVGITHENLSGYQVQLNISPSRFRHHADQRPRPRPMPSSVRRRLPC